ncbi:MAG: OmpA family protein [Clostridiales bacterium]|jgi:chemotaxis protein MotB|nr:OmpA family protein [Clostridiales bacterium]
MARRKPEEPKGGAPEWMATFSDLVTLLFCFFVLLYSMSNVDSAKLQAFASSFRGEPTLLETGQGLDVGMMLGSGIMEMPVHEVGGETSSTEQFETIKDEMDTMYSDFKTYFAENEMSDNIDIIKKEDSLDIVLKDKVLFDKGKNDLRPEAIPILDTISELLLSKYPECDIEFIGHTDTDPINVPRFPNNWYLSNARAISVGEYFINQKGFSPQKVSAKGRGEFNPVAPNDTEENKAKNRRVEIRIYSSFLGSNVS